MVSPNTLSRWMASTRSDRTGAAVVLEAIANAGPTGCKIALSPGDAGTAEQLRRLEAYEATVQAPMIPDLLAGEGRFAGPAGHRPHIDDQATREGREVFRPIDEQIMAWWDTRGKDRLRRTRETAARHLWPMLHDERIPALEAGACRSTGSCAPWSRRSATRGAPGSPTC